MQMFNVQKLISFILLLLIKFFYPSLLFNCFALLCLTFMLLLFLVCFAFA